MAANPKMENVTFRDRDEMYKLIIGQLLYDGQTHLAEDISRMANIVEFISPTNLLCGIVTTHLRNSNKQNGNKPADKNDQQIGCIDLDFDSEKNENDMFDVSRYEPIYYTPHKGASRCGAFSQDGQLIATGSVDTSIKILHVERILLRWNYGDASRDREYESNREDNSHPVIRTLYDHTDEVTALTFHPKEQLLLSGSRDQTIKVFDYSKPNVKRSLNCVQEVSAIRSLTCHPTGEYFLCATNQDLIRLYHMQTFQSFVSPMPSDHHKKRVNCVNYSPTGHLYVSCSDDGDLRVWDSVSGRCVQHLAQAHKGMPITHVRFSRNGKYLLSAGHDLQVRLWELSMGRNVIAYQTDRTAPPTHSIQADFNHTEDFVMMPNRDAKVMVSWSSRKALPRPVLPFGGNHLVNFFAHSPVVPGFLTCSEDHRARFWYHVDRLKR